MRSGEGFNPIRSFQSQADERTGLPLGLGHHCCRRSFFQDNSLRRWEQHGRGLGRVPVAAEKPGCAVVCCFIAGLSRMSVLRSPKESVNRSTAGAVLPHAAVPGALWLLVRNAQGMAGGLISQVMLWHTGDRRQRSGGPARGCGGWAPRSVPSQRLSRQCHVGCSPAAVTRRAWQESQPRHSALSVQFHTIASFFLTCLL